MAKADIVFLCVPGEPQVKEIGFGKDGIVANARPGQTVVDMTTATVDIDRELAAALRGSVEVRPIAAPWLGS